MFVQSIFLSRWHPGVSYRYTSLGVVYLEGTGTHKIIKAMMVPTLNYMQAGYFIVFNINKHVLCLRNYIQVTVI